MAATKIRDLRVGLQVDTNAFERGFKQAQEQTAKFEKALATQEAQAKASARQLDAVGSSALRTRRLLEDATKRLPRIDVEADLSQPERQLADLTAKLRALSGQRIGIDIDPRQVEQQVGEIRRELMVLSDAHPEVVVGANVERALTALEAVEREARKVDGRTARINVDVDGAAAAVAQVALIDTALTALQAAGPAKVAAVGSAIVALPAIASGAAAGIVTVLGGALAGLGLAAARGSKAAQDALAELQLYAQAEARRIGEPFEQVWVTIVRTAERDLAELSPTVRAALEDLAPDVQTFVEQAGDSLGELEPAIQGVQRAFSAILQKLGPALPEIMQHFARAVLEVTNAVEKNPQVVERMAVGIATLAEWTGKLIGWLVKLGEWLHNNTQALVALAAIANPAAGVLSALGIEAGKASGQAQQLATATTEVTSQTQVMADVTDESMRQMAESWSSAYGEFADLAQAIQDSQSNAERQAAAQQRLAQAQERLAEVQRTGAERIKQAQERLADAQEQAADRVEQAQRRVGDAQERAAEQTAQAHERVRAAQQAYADAVEEAAQREADALRRVEDARRRLAQVAEDSNRAIATAVQRVADVQEDAAERELDAERRLRDSHARTADAVEELTAARERAAERLEDLQAQEAGAALDEEGAQLAIERAKARLDEIGTDPEATDLDRREAEYAYKQAVQRLDEVRRRNAQLAEDLAKARDEGVEGSAEVIAAKERIADAQQAEMDAEQALAKQRQDNARQVADAEQALADARVQAVRQQQDAEHALADAQREAARQQQESARSVADAEAALNQARVDEAKAVVNAKRDVADAEREAAKATASAAKDVQDAEESVRKARQDAARDTLKANDDVRKSWVDLGGAVGVTTEQYLAELEKQVRNQEQWADNLIKLAGRVPDEMLAELAKLGPGGADVVALATRMTDVELKKFIDLHGRSGKEAGDAFAENLRLAGPVLRYIALTRGQEVADEVRRGMDDGRTSVLEAAKRIGIDIITGIGKDHEITIFVKTEYQDELSREALRLATREAGGIDRYETGGIERYAAGGVRRPAGPMVATRPTVLFGEGRDDEAFIPYDRAYRARAESLLSQVAGDFGGVYLKPMSMPASATVAAPAIASGSNTYNISVQVPPGADLEAVGAVTVKAIQAYEVRNGSRWRS